MSFTGQVKREIGRQTASARHCRIAELAALLSFDGTIQISEEDQISILFQTEQEVVCGVFLELLRKLNEEYTISMLFISHNLKVVRKLCSRVAVMQRGLIVEVGETDQVFFHPQHPYTRHLIDAIPSRERRFL